MKLYIISWQQGFGIASILYIHKKNAQKKYDDYKIKMEKIQADSNTAVNYAIIDTLTLKEIETEDEMYD